MPNNRFRNVFLVGIAAGIALIILGWILTPAEKLTGVLAATAIIVEYGIVAWFAPQRVEKMRPAILPTAILLGVIAGLIFTIEIILEYILLPKDNTTFGLVEFGSVFFLYLLAGAITAYRTNSIRNGVLSAVGAAIIATLIWTIVTLSVFYLFRGTPQQTRIFQAEGNYADFAQSGMKNFNSFIMEDFMGAVFFHSMLGPILASILGMIGGVIGRGIARIRSK
jgi:hypothetical protein